MSSLLLKLALLSRSWGGEAKTWQAKAVKRKTMELKCMFSETVLRILVGLGSESLECGIF